MNKLANAITEYILEECSNELTVCDVRYVEVSVLRDAFSGFDQASMDAALVELAREYGVRHDHPYGQAHRAGARGEVAIQKFIAHNFVTTRADYYVYLIGARIV